ncbi:MAG: EAL domain-containing protein [Aquisalimonadaceae bacterium]
MTERQHKITAPVGTNDHRYQISSEGLLQAVFLAGDNPVLLVEIRTRKILACNAAIERVFGYRPSELIGCETEVLHVDKQSYQAFGEESDRVLYQGSGSYHSHYWMRRRDGARFPSEHLVQLIYDDDGEPYASISIVRDVTETGDAPDIGKAHDAQETGFRALAKSLPGFVYQRVRTPDGTDRYTFLAGGLFQRYGLDPDVLRADPSAFFRGVLEPERHELEDEIGRSHCLLTPIDMEVRFRVPDGPVIWLKLMSQPRRLDDGSVAWDGFALDISQEKDSEQRLHHLATHDQITGLPNRYQVMAYLEQIIAGVRRRKGRFAVAYLDVRGMTQINEAYGFARGDQLLRCIGERLNGCVGPRDLVGRSHSDGLLVVLSIDDISLADALRRLQSVFDQPFRLADDAMISSSVKIGIALYPEDGSTAEDLLQAAHTARDHARRTPDCEYAFYARELGAQMRVRVHEEQALRDAIEAGELVPYFQPQRSLADRSLVGLEALVRWEKPDGQLVAPDAFIPLAEETGLILALDLLVLRKVAAQIKAWLADGLSVPVVSVNCSAHQFRSSAFEEAYRREVISAGLDPGIVGIEITETSLGSDFAAANRIMNSLVELGVRFSIDDFGTGFSSLGSLAQLPFHTLKIDRSFVSAIGTDGRQRAITESLIRMSDALGLFVIAEGVETSAQETRLRRLGCDAAQGFLYSPAVPAADVRGWLRTVAGFQDVAVE